MRRIIATAIVSRLSLTLAVAKETATTPEFASTIWQELQEAAAEYRAAFQLRGRYLKASYALGVALALVAALFRLRWGGRGL